MADRIILVKIVVEPRVVRIVKGVDDQPQLRTGYSMTKQSHIYEGVDDQPQLCTGYSMTKQSQIYEGVDDPGGGGGPTDSGNTRVTSG